MLVMEGLDTDGKMVSHWQQMPVAFCIKIIFFRFQEYVVKKQCGLNMENQMKTRKREEKKWAVIRNYQSKFTCTEAVERLIKIHNAAGEESDGKEKSQIPSA